MITQREVLSRADAEAREFDRDTLIISINGTDEKNAYIKGGSTVAPFRFDDVDETESGMAGYTHMDEEQAQEIVYFIKKTGATKLVVHCHAGICRSSAIVQAFLEDMFGMNSPVITRFFQTGRYVPNTWVRNKMREAFKSFVGDEERRNPQNSGTAAGF